MEYNSERKSLSVAVVRVVKLRCVVIPYPIDWVLIGLDEHRIDVIKKTLEM